MCYKEAKRKIKHRKNTLRSLTCVKTQFYTGKKWTRNNYLKITIFENITGLMKDINPQIQNT